MQGLVAGTCLALTQSPCKPHWNFLAVDPPTMVTRHSNILNHPHGRPLSKPNITITADPSPEKIGTNYLAIKALLPIRRPSALQRTSSLLTRTLKSSWRKVTSMPGIRVSKASLRSITSRSIVRYRFWIGRLHVPRRACSVSFTWTDKVSFVLEIKSSCSRMRNGFIRSTMKFLGECVLRRRCWILKILPPLFPGLWFLFRCVLVPWIVLPPKRGSPRFR